MYLGLVCSCVNVSGRAVGFGRLRTRVSGDSVHWFHTCAHYPLTVIADSDTLTSLLKFEVLQEFDTTCVLRIGFETSFSLSSKPFW